MNKLDDISATEKLLDIIRAENEFSEKSGLAMATSDSSVDSDVAPDNSSDIPDKATEITDIADVDLADEDEADPILMADACDGDDCYLPDFFERLPRPQVIRKVRSVRGLTVTVGVDIRPSSISFVKASEANDHLGIEDYAFMPLADRPFSYDTASPDSIFNDQGVKQVLKKRLGSFCAGPDACEIWCSLPREFIEVHSLTIPPVPTSEVANAVFWATRKHISFEEEKTILDFILLDGPISAKKQAVIVFLAPSAMVAAYKKLFVDIGSPLTGLTSPSVGFQNQIKKGWITTPDSFALLHVEEQNSFIDLYHNGNWIFGREIKTGLKSFVDSVIEEAESRGVNIDYKAAKQALFSGKIEMPEPVVGVDEDDILHIEADEPDAGFDLPAAERLVRQLERTFDYCVSTFGTPRATGIYISGPPAASNLFINSIGSESGLQCQQADPYNVAAKKFGGVFLPQDIRQRCVMNAAFGLAFSRKQVTQNFLNTYQKRVTEILIRKIDKIILTAFAAIALVIATVFAFQHYKVTKTDEKLAFLKQQLDGASFVDGEKVNESRLLALTQKVLSRRVAGEALATKNYQVGLIGEITRLTPERIKLVRLSIAPVAEGAKPPASKDAKRAVIEGVVLGMEQSREFVMTGFIQQLAGSPLVKEATFLQKHTTAVGKEKGLYFIAAVTPRATSVGGQKAPRPQRAM